MRVFASSWPSAADAYSTPTRTGRGDSSFCLLSVGAGAGVQALADRGLRVAGQVTDSGVRHRSTERNGWVTSSRDRSEHSDIPAAWCIRDSSLMQFLWDRVRRLEKAGRITAIAEMLDDPDLADRNQLRGHILETLAKYDQPVATAALVHALRHDPRPIQRVDVAVLLAKHPERPGVEPVLIEALADTESDYRIRMHAARGLASRSNENAATSLISALHDPDSGVRGEAARSLGAIGTSQPQVVEALAHALEDSSGSVRFYASRSLSRLGARSARPAMQRARNRTWSPMRFALSRHIKDLDD